jgi:hypothetical protein
LEKAAQEAKADDVFMNMLKRFAREGRNASHNPAAARIYAPTQFAKETEAVSAGVRKPELETAMLRLFEAGKIHVETYGKASQPHERLAEGPSTFQE